MNEYIAGATSVVDLIFIQDSSSTTGAGKTGLAYNTSSLTCYYKRSNGTASVAVTLADISTLGTFTSGGFKAVDGTNMPGCYEFHPPDAAFASGAKEVTFFFTGASGMVSRPIKYRIHGGLNPDDAVRAGLTALPNAAAADAGGLFTRGTGAGQINQETNGRIDVNVVAVGGSTATTATTVDANVTEVNVTNRATFAGGIVTNSWNNTGATTYAGNIVKGGTETGVIAYQGSIADEINNNGSTFQYPADTFAADSDFTGMTMVFTSSTIPAARKIIDYSRNSSIESSFTLDQQPAHDYQQGDTFLILYDRGHAVTTPAYSPVLQGASNLATTFAGFAAGGLTMTSIRNSGATTYVGAISAPNTSNSWAGTLARVTLVDTTTDLTNGGSGDIEITEQDVTIS